MRILACKTTLKDRWRQIGNEANRIDTKHVLTIQDGMSENQFLEASDVNLRLVVPEPLHGKYAKSIQPALIDLESFIAEIRLLRT